MTENHGMVSMHDVFDAEWLFETFKEESYLRRIVQPLEVCLMHFPRIMVKDTCVNAIC
jgi:H/ACA ribonucleoprotein complex subunit 4